MSRNQTLAEHSDVAVVGQAAISPGLRPTLSRACWIASIIILFLAPIGPLIAQSVPAAGGYNVAPAAPGGLTLNTPTQFTFQARPPLATNAVNWIDVVFADPALYTNGTGTAQTTCTMRIGIAVGMADSTGTDHN